MFSRGKEVISFPAFVCVWMWATLFQQYSLVSTTLSILTKIYNLSVPCYSRWSHKNRNFLNWFDSPHLVSALFFLFFYFTLGLTRFLPSQNIPCRVIVRWENTLQSKCQQYIWNYKLNVMKTLSVLKDDFKCDEGVSKKYLPTEGAFDICF